MGGKQTQSKSKASEDVEVNAEESQPRCGTNHEKKERKATTKKKKARATTTTKKSKVVLRILLLVRFSELQCTTYLMVLG